jgi:peptide/nickel transport system ATP-binding protein
MTHLLKVEGLQTCLRGGENIVDGISFGIGAGETLALLGESGCGKSMTALSLLKLLPDGVAHAGGEMWLEGMALHAMSEREMRAMRGSRMAMIFQEPGLSLNPVMTVGAQIMEVLALHQGLQDEAARARSIELLNRVGIPDAVHRVDEYPFQMSGGMKQRVMIAMALAGKPRLLIADEPTTALDVTIQAQVLQLLRETQQANGMAMLLITHDLGVVAENAHRVGVMYAGQLIEQATREQLFAHPLHPYTQKLFAALPDVRRADRSLAAIPGNVPPIGSVAQGCRFAPRCDRAWSMCREVVPGWTTVDGRNVRCHLYDKAAQGRDGAAEDTSSPGGRLATAPVAGKGSEVLLEVEGLRVHFPIRKGLLQRAVGHVKAVDGVSFAIPRGRTLALVGESGCGKSTLGKALLNLHKPTDGRIRFGGEVLTEDALRSRMQMVFQDPYASLNPRMRVAEILEEGMAALGVGADGTARQAHIDGLLDKVGLAGDSKWRYPHEFSGGQRQRIAIARALAVSPELLICDEPTSALDVSVQAQILNLLRSLQCELGLSYLFITHNLAVVEYLAHEVCVMYLGRIVEQGPVREVMRTPAHPYTRALLSAVPRIDGGNRQLLRLEGELPSPSRPPEGCHFAPRCPQVMPACTRKYPGMSTVDATTHVVSCHLYG